MSGLSLNKQRSSSFKQFHTFPFYLHDDDGPHVPSPGPGDPSSSAVASHQGWPASSPILAPDSGHTKQDSPPQTESSQVFHPSKFKSLQTWSTSLSLSLPPIPLPPHLSNCHFMLLTDSEICSFLLGPKSRTLSPL